MQVDNGLKNTMLRVLLSIWRGFPKKPKSIWSWISISYGVLPILISGLCWVAINQNDSSGAVLVGCTIVSQALLQIWPMAGFLGGRKSKVQISTEALNPNIPKMVVISGYDFEKAKERLRNIAIESELKFPSANGDTRWLMELTISRVHLALEWCIVIFAVIGTLVWAYAPK